MYFWGDRHREIFLGLERAARISPARSALDRGLRFTLHDDAPVTPPNPLRTLASAVERRTQGGNALGTDQALPVLEALRAMTAHAAFQMGEEASKGVIGANMRADLVVLDRNPLTVTPGSLRDIQVSEVIKDGAVIWPGPE